MRARVCVCACVSHVCVFALVGTYVCASMYACVYKFLLWLEIGVWCMPSSFSIVVYWSTVFYEPRLFLFQLEILICGSLPLPFISWDSSQIGCDIYQDYMVSGIHMQVLIFLWHMLYQLSYLPRSANFNFSYIFSDKCPLLYVWMPQLWCALDIITSLKDSDTVINWLSLTYLLALSEQDCYDYT